MKRVILIHGWQGEPGNHWKGWFKSKLEERGITVIEPNMPNESNKPEDWIKRLAQIIWMPDKETILIGHSLGCPTAIWYLMQLTGDGKIAGTILVAGFHKLPGVEALKLWNFDSEEVKKAKNHCDTFISIVSDNDSSVSFEESEELNDLLGGKLILEHNKWHFCEEDGVTELQSVYDAVIEIFWI